MFFQSFVHLEICRISSICFVFGAVNKYARFKVDCLKGFISRLSQEDCCISRVDLQLALSTLDTTIHFPHNSVLTSIFKLRFCLGLIQDLCATKQRK